MISGAPKEHDATNSFELWPDLSPFAAAEGHLPAPHAVKLSCMSSFQIGKRARTEQPVYSRKNIRRGLVEETRASAFYLAEIRYRQACHVYANPFSAGGIDPTWLGDFPTETAVSLTSYKKWPPLMRGNAI
jgi:hypothetical protein